MPSEKKAGKTKNIGLKKATRRMGGVERGGNGSGIREGGGGAFDRYTGMRYGTNDSHSISRFTSASHS
jgi:hypothetical protein